MGSWPDYELLTNLITKFVSPHGKFYVWPVPKRVLQTFRGTTPSQRSGFEEGRNSGFFEPFFRGRFIYLTQTLKRFRITSTATGKRQIQVDNFAEKERNR